jgi:predicted extracellular nuclease
MYFKIGTFNVENLFGRAKLLNFKNHEVGEKKLKELKQLKSELKKSTYDKTKTFNLYNKLKKYIKIEEDRGKLFKREKFKIVGIKADGVKDWDGHIVLKRDEFKDIARRNTAKVIRRINADIMCLIEVENRPVLKSFNSQLLYSKKYPYNMLIDGNDNRGIDVSLLSRFKIGAIYTHIFDRKGKSKVFSRDCLEVQILLPNGNHLWVLINHLKSKGWGKKTKNDARRTLQADKIVDLLKKYNLKKDLVVVLGDFNDIPTRKPLKNLINLPHLYDVLDLQFPNNTDARWTYHYNKNEQIDYILISKPLKDKFNQAAVERRGIYDVHKYTGGSIKAWSSVQKNGHIAAASDHGAVWADFNF